LRARVSSQSPRPRRRRAAFAGSGELSFFGARSGLAALANLRCSALRRELLAGLLWPDSSARARRICAIT
jgi:hypothetical protein